jgi:hypothetical protein
MIIIVLGFVLLLWGATSLVAVVWQAVLSAGVLLVICAAVSSHGDPDKTLATIQCWVSPVKQLLLPGLQLLKEAWGTTGSISSQSYEQQYWQQQRQQAPTGEDKSSKGRCSYVGVEYRDGERLYSIHLHMRKHTRTLGYTVPDGITAAQLSEAMECAAEEFNAADSPAVRKLALTAQAAKVQELVN